MLSMLGVCRQNLVLTDNILKYFSNRKVVSGYPHISRDMNVGRMLRPSTPTFDFLHRQIRHSF